MDREDLLHPNFPPLLVTGFLGGFTMFLRFRMGIVRFSGARLPRWL